jgi:hypothetical protein
VRIARVLCLCALGACRAGVPALEQPPQADAGTPPERKTTMSQHDASVSDPDPMPKLALEAAPRYLIGFPLVVAVTYDNRSGQTDFFLLPDVNLLSAPWGIGLSLAPLSGGAAVEIRPGSSHEEIPHGIGLKPGEARRMLLDLSSFGIALPPESTKAYPNLGPSLLQPGKYRLTVILRGAGSEETTSSNPVTVEIVEPEPADAMEATRLRGLGVHGFDSGGWQGFLASNWNAVVPSPSLSFEAQRQLALHLFLHRAFYGPEPVARLDEALLGRITEPSLAADVAAFRYEIHAARGAPDAKPMLDDLLARWSGMRWRFAERKDALGHPLPLALADGRRLYGAESPRAQHPGQSPYTK